MTGTPFETVSRRAVISLATTLGTYPERQARLVASLRRVGFAGELMCWSPGRFPDGCPDHLEVPFAFKPHCFMEARRAGFNSVLWLDASCVAIRPLEPLFEKIERDGHLLFRNGHLALGQWAGDEALAWLGLERAEALTVPEVNAAAIGLHLRKETARTFLDEWDRAARAAVPFRGTPDELADWEDYDAVKWNRSGRVSSDPAVRGHRHDQTVAGALAHRLGMELATEGLQCYWRGRRIRVRPSTAIVLDRNYGGAGGRRALRARRDKQLGRLAHRLDSPSPRSAAR